MKEIMKSKLFIKVREDGLFALVEQKQVVQEVELTATANYDELGPVIESAGFKSVSATAEARALIKAIRQEAKKANDVKRQEREAKRAAKKAEQIAKLQARLAKLQTSN
jgi:hypothetical protein